jgi:hypothetical protein
VQTESPRQNGVSRAAPLGARISAAAIDLLALGAISGILAALVVPLMDVDLHSEEVSHEQDGAALILVGLALLAVAMTVFAMTFIQGDGRTIGLGALGLRIQMKRKATRIETAVSRMAPGASVQLGAGVVLAYLVGVVWPVIPIAIGAGVAVEIAPLMFVRPGQSLSERAGRYTLTVWPSTGTNQWRDSARRGTSLGWLTRTVLGRRRRG